MQHIWFSDLPCNDAMLALDDAAQLSSALLCIFSVHIVVWIVLHIFVITPVLQFRHWLARAYFSIKSYKLKGYKRQQQEEIQDT